MRNDAGLSLVETVIALLILTFVSTAVVLLTVQILSLTNSAKMKNQATTYAEQVLEQVRDFEVTYGWGGLAAKGPNGCYTDVVSWTAASGSCVTDCSNPNLVVSSSDTRFFRYVTITAPAAGAIKVSAVVTWKDKGVCRNTTIDTYFYQ